MIAMPTHANFSPASLETTEKTGPGIALPNDTVIQSSALLIEWQVVGENKVRWHEQSGAGCSCGCLPSERFPNRRFANLGSA